MAPVLGDLAGRVLDEARAPAAAGAVLPGRGDRALLRARRVLAGDPGSQGRRDLDADSTYSNWHQIAAGTSYFAASGPVSPLEHTWSLAIEEQFYLCWPILLGGVLWLASRGRSGSSRRPLLVLLGLSVAGVVASAIDTALLFDGGKRPRPRLLRDRHARGQPAGRRLAGDRARLSVAKAAGRRGSDARPGRSALGAAVALAGVLAATALVQRIRSAWLYPYGLLGLDLAVVAADRRRGRVPGLARGARDRRPAAARAREDLLRAVPVALPAVPVARPSPRSGSAAPSCCSSASRVTVAISVVSYVLIEQPIRQRRRPTWLVRALTPLAAGGAVASLLLASAADELPVGVPAAATLPQPPPALAGNGPACTVTLKDTPQYGLAPPPASKETKFEYNALGYHQLSWSGSAQKTFQTCPPKSVLVVGDSMAFTLGAAMARGRAALRPRARRRGAPRLRVHDGRASSTSTAPGRPSRPAARPSWRSGRRTKQELHAKAVVVELGYRDQFDWKINGKVVHLGQPAFDAYVREQIDQFVRVLGAGGTKILFLSVPYTKPAATIRTDRRRRPPTRPVIS